MSFRERFRVRTMLTILIVIDILLYIMRGFPVVVFIFWLNNWKIRFSFQRQ